MPNGQRLLLRYKISSRSPGFAKREVTNLTLRRSLSPVNSASMWYNSRLTSFFFYFVTTERQPSVHSACSMLNIHGSVTPPYLMEKILVFNDLTNSMFNWNWCGSESCNLFSFVRYSNECWLFLQDSNCNHATALSILVIIVKFLFTATCVLF